MGQIMSIVRATECIAGVLPEQSDDGSDNEEININCDCESDCCITTVSET